MRKNQVTVLDGVGSKQATYLCHEKPARDLRTQTSFSLGLLGAAVPKLGLWPKSPKTKALWQGLRCTL